MQIFDDLFELQHFCRFDEYAMQFIEALLRLRFVSVVPDAGLHARFA